MGVVRKNLTMVVNNVKKRQKDRIVEGTIHPLKMREVLYRQRLVRGYTSGKLAIECLHRWLVSYGQPGDFCETYSKLSGKQIAVLKMTSKGKIITQYNEDEMTAD